MEIASPNVAQVMQQDSGAGGGQSGVSGGTTTNGPVSMAAAFAAAIEAERPPTWQLDLMMEKLRQKSNQLKPLSETSKNIRMALQERRYFLDQGDRLHLQKCLDTLQQSIKVSSLQSMVERLEMVSRQLGLKFTPGATGNEWFISSDMFYFELLIDQSGTVQEVKIQHDGKTEAQPAPEVVACLRKKDFTDFTAHLEGLVAIYQLNADKKIKSKAFIALQALESDLLAMASTYAHVKDGEAVVMKSLLGLVQPRKGGHPVKLTYFISPYEFLDVNSKVTLPGDVDTIVDKKLGNTATVCIQASMSRKLQMSTTVAIMRGSDGKNHPRYGTLNATNSTALPACFTVNLGKPIPICKELLQIIQNATGIHCFDFSSPRPILSLITQHYSGGTLDCSNNRGLFVALPDTPNTLQVHCYFMTETPNLEGILVSSINFTLASQLPQVIAILRQQLIFNTLVGSCVRVGSKPDMECLVFEVNALSHQNVSVSFQHPLEDSLVTLEFNLTDVSHPTCQLHAVTNYDIIPTLEEHACKVVQRSLSIPITVRAVIRRWQTMKSKFEPPNPEFNIPVGGSFGSDSINQVQSNDITCGAESERVQTHQSSGQQNTMVPGMVMGLSNNVDSSGSTSSNNSSVNPVSSSNPVAGRHPSGNANYTISPVQQSGSGNQALNSFTSPSPTQQNPQNPMDLLSSYMSPLFLSNQLSNLGGGLPGNFPGLTLQNLQNLSGLLDQVGQRGRRRKRKGTSSDTTPIPPLPTGGMNIQGNPNVTRPSPSPSPKSPRQMFPNKSPKRRPSEGSDVSDTSQGDSRAATPQTPLTPHASNSALNMLMTEMGLEMPPDSRWNIDITPVGVGGNQSSIPPTMESLLASKILSGFGNAAAAAAAAVANTNQNSGGGGSDFHMELDSDLDAPDGNVNSEFGNKFSIPQNKKVKQQKPRDFPKRSISLDSHSGAGDDNISNNLQSFLNSASAGVAISGDSTDFKPLVTPSLSITPVPTNASSTQSTVNSLLANMRTGIEIIPLPNPVQIPNSITVTPINPKALTTQLDKDGSNGKKSTTLVKEIKKEDTSNPEGTTTIKKKLGSVSDSSSSKKERKRKASSVLAPLLDEEGLPVHDFNAKQPKLLPFGTVSSSASGGTSITSITDKKSGMSFNLKNASPPFGLNMKKPGSPSLNRAPTPNKGNSPTPKMGGKPSVSTLKSVSGSPKYPDVSSLQSSKKPNKERKGNSFQGNSKIAKNLSLVGNPNAVANLMPTLKSLNDGSLPLSLASLNPNLLGVANSNAMKTEANMAEALLKANLLNKSVMDATKAQLQGSQSASTQAAQVAAAAVAAQLQRSNSTGGNGSSGNNSNSSSNGGGGTGTVGTTGKKVGNLLAVIDKLRSSQSVSGDDSSKKDNVGNKVDYLKASAGMTSDVMQLKKSQNTSGSGGNSGSSSSDNTSSGGNSQYVVKPGQLGGLKMTLGKTKSAPSLSGSKDKAKSGMKSSGTKKSSFSGIKPPSLSSSASGSAGSGTTKPVPSLSSINSSTKKTSSSSSSSSGSSNKDKERDSSEKSSKSQKTGNGSTPSSKKGDDESDLTRKLFMPGGLDAPKFDITKYQIPKKSSSSSSSGSTPLAGASESSPKNTAPSPSSTPMKLDKESSKDEKETKIPEAKEKSEAVVGIGDMSGLANNNTNSSAAVLLSSTVEKTTAPVASNEPTKIKLSSAAIGSSENFLEEMNKLFPSKGSLSAGSPMNLSSSSTAPKSHVSSESSSVSVGEPDSTTGEPSGLTTTAASKDDGKREEVKQLSPPHLLPAVQPPAATASESFTSPESPEPFVGEEPSKNTVNIPTTPQTTAPPVQAELPVASAVPAAPLQASPLPGPGDDDDQLVIDVEKRAAAEAAAAARNNGSLGLKEDGTKAGGNNGGSSECMPPPPVPDSTSSAFTVTTSSTPAVTSSTSSSSSLSTGSPSPSAPTSNSATVPIVSVHIVHSPQPNSPALLRSPLVVQSPHSSHASPYPIDDDLMDEALIGTGK